MKEVLLAFAVIVFASIPASEALAQDQPGKVAVVDSRSVVMAVQGLG